MRLFIALRRRGLSCIVIFPLLAVATLGCGREREQTTDPAEIEKIRQEHVNQAEREMQESS